jgi:hypothetical protein
MPFKVNYISLELLRNHQRVRKLLLLPWPLRVRESDFRPWKGRYICGRKEPFGFFEFAPSDKLDLELVSRLIIAAREEVDSVDVLVLPECAVDESEINDLEALLDFHGVVALMTGVRKRSSGQLPSNWVHTGFGPRLEKRAETVEHDGVPMAVIRSITSLNTLMWPSIRFAWAPRVRPYQIHSLSHSPRVHWKAMNWPSSRVGRKL